MNNKTLHITASFDKPAFIEDLVERLAERRIETGLGLSSTEAYVGGDVSLVYATDENPEARINMPFITCFLFTCRKAKDGSYKLAWSMSLS